MSPPISVSSSRRQHDRVVVGVHDAGGDPVLGRAVAGWCRPQAAAQSFSMTRTKSKTM